MILRDYKSIFAGNFQLIKEVSHLFLTLHKHHNYELPEVYNEKIVIEESIMEEYSTLSEEEVKELLAKALFRMIHVNSSIVKEIYDQVIYKNRVRKIKFSDLNINVLLNTANEMLFSDKLLLAVLVSCVNSDQDLNYLKESFFEEYDVSTGDLVYLFYTMDFICQNKSDYIKKYIEEEVKANYIREDVYMAIYMTLCEVQDSFSRKELINILSDIHNFKENLSKVGYEREDLDNLEILMSI